MKNILIIGASSSQNSINKQLAVHAGEQLSDVKLTVLDLNEYEMPIYSIDKEKKNGIPELAQQFKALISSSDGIIISFAEHNGSFSAAYKNIYDWNSRLEGSVWMDKPMILLATSPGARGGLGVLTLANTIYGYANKNVVGHMSLPSFHTNFDTVKGITDETMKASLKELLTEFQSKV